MKRTISIRKTPFKPRKKPPKRMRPGQEARPTAQTLCFKQVAMLFCACCGIEGYAQAAHSNRYQSGKGTRSTCAIR